MLSETAFRGSFSINDNLNSISFGIVTDLDEIIKRAESEVEKYTMSFRTFNNSQCLIKEFAEETNQYRYKLISFIKLKFSDY